MPTCTAAETARRCRIQAALTTSPDVRHCLLRMAEHYEVEARAEAKGEGEERDLPPVPNPVPSDG